MRLFFTFYIEISRPNFLYKVCFKKDNIYINNFVNKGREQNAYNFRKKAFNA